MYRSVAPYATVIAVGLFGEPFVAALQPEDAGYACA